MTDEKGKEKGKKGKKEKQVEPNAVQNTDLDAGKKEKPPKKEKAEKKEKPAKEEKSEKKGKKKGEKEHKPGEHKLEWNLDEDGSENAGAPKKKGKKTGGKSQTLLDLEASRSRINLEKSMSAFVDQYASQHRILDEDEWTWESYSTSSVSISEIVTVTETTDKTKGKKGKKGAKSKEDNKSAKKKSEKDKEIEPVAPVAPAPVDIMAEINRMKAMAEAQAQAPAERVSISPSQVSGKSRKSTKSGKSAKTEKTEKSKKSAKSAADGDATKKKGKEKAVEAPEGPKKKLTKKEKAKLAAELAEQKRIQAEIEAKLAEETERLRVIAERKAAIEKQKRETSEQAIRTEHLSNVLHMFRGVESRNSKKGLKDKGEREWKQYLKCDGLPDPNVCGQLNTYLHLWEQRLETTTIDDAAAQTIEALYLLDILTTLIDDPIGIEQSKLENWRWIHRVFRKYQQQNLDTATYRLLRDIRNNLNRADLSKADYSIKEKNFSLFLWLLIRLPTSMPNPRKPAQPPIHIDIPEIHMNVLFPHSVECDGEAIRIMYVKYDHLSDLCSTFYKPPVPEPYKQDLHMTMLEEWNSKLFYKYENRKKKHNEVGPNGEPVVEEEEFVDRAAGIIPTVPYQKLEPSASEHVIAEEDELYSQLRESLRKNVENDVINLRKYMMIGGTYFLDLYYQPPQPQGIVSYEISLARLQIPKCLREVPFHVRYDTPPPPDSMASRQPQEIEDDLKKQEELLSELMLVTLTLPNHVMWFDIPIICHWDKRGKVWTKEDVHDLKHIEDAGYLTFRTGRFGCFGMAANRYANLPYQAWELKPEANGTVTFQITAAILLIEFNIRNDLICILQFQNSPNKALREIIGVYYRLPKLIRILQEGGVDLFPGFDAFCYVEGTCEKHWPMEQHTYKVMALLCTCMNFMWSRWNMVAGRRSLVMQMKEYKSDKPKQDPYNMTLVTPLKATYIDCTEISPVFNNEAIEGMLFYCDLYQLMKGTCGIATRTKVQSTPADLIGTVSELLIATRILSFS